MSMHLSLSKMAELLACTAPDVDVLITGAEIDSRKLKTGNLFVALAGERVDGHDYLAQARKAGACAALVSRLQDDELPQLVVDDVTVAFGQLAKYCCEQSKAKVVAITGSNGKTTVKEMVANILRQSGNVIATLGNLNNNLGVPLTLFRLTDETDYAVIEMGANHAGEIAQLVDIAKPTVAVINNVAAAHIEGFGSLQGVAEAKAEIFSTLDAAGTGVINADMEFINFWQKKLTANNSIRFALDHDADIVAKNVELNAGSSHFMVELDDVLHYINLPLPGRHNVANALAAISVCVALAIPAESIVSALAAMSSVPHRLQLRSGARQSKLIDDSYNANPGSYQQALNALKEFSGQHWLVLGDFGELGDDSKQIHYDLGLQAKEAGVQRLLTIGELSQGACTAFGEGAEHFSDIASLQQRLQSELNQEVICLIKGSRFMQLDKLADALAEVGEH